MFNHAVCHRLFVDRQGVHVCPSVSPFLVATGLGLPWGGGG
jgi:hypothetical protein